MLNKRKGFPQEDELVMATVTSVQAHGVFAALDEYDGRSGMIHISEIAPGRIRNIRDYVVEGKKIVCKILRINLEKGHIDMSLRRVNERERRLKNDEIKQEQIAEKIVEAVAAKLKLDVKALHEDVLAKTKSERLFSLFEEVASGEANLEQFLDKNTAQELTSVISQRIKKPEVEIRGDLKLRSFAPEGIEIIKAALIKAQESAKDAMQIRYQGAGDYKVILKAEDYKTAEKILKQSVDAATLHMQKHKGEAEFVRQEA